jgi:hypothetical protein
MSGSRHHEVNVEGALDRERVHHYERVHPAAMRGRDQQKAAAAREMLLTGRRDPEPEQPEQDGSGDQAHQPVEQRRP